MRDLQETREGPLTTENLDGGGWAREAPENGKGPTGCWTSRARARPCRVVPCLAIYVQKL